MRLRQMSQRLLNDAVLLSFAFAQFIEQPRHSLVRVLLVDDNTKNEHTETGDHQPIGSIHLPSNGGGCFGIVFLNAVENTVWYRPEFPTGRCLLSGAS